MVVGKHSPTRNGLTMQESVEQLRSLQRLKKSRKKDALPEIRIYDDEVDDRVRKKSLKHSHSESVITSGLSSYYSQNKLKDGS